MSHMISITILSHHSHWHTSCGALNNNSPFANLLIKTALSNIIQINALLIRKSEFTKKEKDAPTVKFNTSELKVQQTCN